jgi:sec-independent protein translocase protein TatC
MTDLIIPDQITNLLKSKSLTNISKNAAELTNLVFKMVLVWGIGLGITYLFQTPIYNLYVAPLKENNLTLHFLSPTDSISFYIKVFGISSLVITSPVQVLLFWLYIKDAMAKNEQTVVKNYFWVGAILSIAATIYGWLFLIPSVFKFLISINPPQSQLLLSSKEYSSFVFGMLLTLILTFQIPLVVFGLIRSGLVTKKQITDKRRHIYVAILIITALFGSPDVLTWLLSTIPVIGLFEFSLILSHYKFKTK